MARVLVVDDDRALIRALRVALAARGHDITVAATGDDGITQAALAEPDVVVLDLGLPDLDGLVVCARIREWSAVPVIVLSATDSEERKVAALNLGADDYVTKPFGMDELEARIRAALRRSQRHDSEPNQLASGPLQVDLLHHETRLGGRPLDLTAREFDLLAFLVRHAGRTCTRQMILESVWGYSNTSQSSHLRVYIHRLRQKLGDEQGHLIRSIPGIGYSLCAEAEGATTVGAEAEPSDWQPPDPPAQ